MHSPASSCRSPRRLACLARKINSGRTKLGKPRWVPQTNWPQPHSWARLLAVSLAPRKGRSVLASHVLAHLSHLRHLSPQLPPLSRTSRRACLRQPNASTCRSPATWSAVRMDQGLAAGLQNIPGAGDKIAQAANKTVTALGSAADRVKEGFGTGSPAVGGSYAKDAMSEWLTGGSKNVASRVYDAVDNLVKPDIATPLTATAKAAQEILARRAASKIPGKSRQSRRYPKPSRHRRACPIRASRDCAVSSAR